MAPERPNMMSRFRNIQRSREKSDMSKVTLSVKAARAVQKYGLDACLKAYDMHKSGYGASGIAHEGPSELRTTQQADAAINAGREYIVFTTGKE